jgi:hypothetical protein
MNILGDVIFAMVLIRGILTRSDLYFLDLDPLSQPISQARPLLHLSHELLSNWNINPMSASAAQNRPSNRIQLRSLILLNVLLHRAAHVRREGRYSGDHFVSIHRPALSHRDRARLAQTPFTQTPPLRVGKNLADSFIRSGCAQRKRSQKNQLTPHQRRLIVDKLARKADLLKLINCRSK